MGLMPYTDLGAGVVGYLGNIQFLMHSDYDGKKLKSPTEVK